MTPRKHDLWLTKCKNRVLRGPIDSERSVDVRDQASNMPRLIRMLGAIATKVGPMSLARNSQRCASTTRGLPTAQENADSRAGKICGHSVAQHRLAWRAVQWRAWLGEARRTGRGLVAGRPC